MDRRIEVMKNFLQKKFDEGTQRTNCFNNGRRLFSYGTHYVMAEWTGSYDEENNEILIVNEYRCSVTTSRMLREFSSVLRDARGIRVLRHEGGNILRYYLEEAVESLKAVRRAMSWSEHPESYFHEAILALKRAMALVGKLEGYKDVDPLSHLYISAQMDDSLTDCRNKIRGGMSKELAAAIYLMVKNGTERYANEIKKMPIQYITAYKMLGGETEVKKSVQNPLWNFLWLKDHLEAEEAIRLVSSHYPALRRIAVERLEKGVAG